MSDSVEESVRFDFKAANARARWKVFFGIVILLIYLLVQTYIARGALIAIIVGFPGLWLILTRNSVPKGDRGKLVEEWRRRYEAATASYREICGDLRGKELVAAQRTYYQSAISSAVSDVEKRLPKKLLKKLRADHAFGKNVATTTDELQKEDVD